MSLAGRAADCLAAAGLGAAIRAVSTAAARMAAPKAAAPMVASSAGAGSAAAVTEEESAECSVVVGVGVAGSEGAAREVAAATGMLEAAPRAADWVALRAELMAGPSAASMAEGGWEASRGVPREAVSRAETAEAALVAPTAATGDMEGVAEAAHRALRCRRRGCCGWMGSGPRRYTCSGTTRR